MKFNYSQEPENANPDPEYDKPYGSELPPITSRGNLTYLQVIDVITQLWNRANPEVPLVPFGPRRIYDPEKGYIVYGLETRRPRNNNSKPKLFRTQQHPTQVGVLISTFIQTFDNIVNFSAVHVNPRTAEEIIESFEDFMLLIIPKLTQLGIEQCFYNRRLPDEHDQKYGDDVAVRKVNYMIVTQKMLHVDVKQLDSVVATITLNQDATPFQFVIS